MSPLIDLLETYSLPVEEVSAGRYDLQRCLRVDDLNRPIVEAAGSALSTQTRGGSDRDDGPAAHTLGTITKQEADRDEPLSLVVTKTGGGRDTDEPVALSALLGTTTFAGPDRD